jgi:hypothetical protein
MIELSGPEFAFAVIAVAVSLIPLTIWAIADLVHQRETRRMGRFAAQRRSIRR